MFCKNCGNSIDENQVFCPVCGCRTENGEAPSDINNAPAAASNGFSAPQNLGEGENAVNQPEVQVSQAPEQQFVPVQEDGLNHSVQDAQPLSDGQGYSDFVGTVDAYPVKKKSKKLKIFFASVASVLVVAIIAGVIWWDDIYFNMFASTDEKYQTVQSDSVAKLAGSVSDTVNTVGDFAEIICAFGGEGAISKDNSLMGMNGLSAEVMIGDDLKDLIGDAIEDSIGYGVAVDTSIIDWINSMAVNSEITVNTNAIGVDYGYSINSVDIVDAQYIFDIENGDFYLSSPSIFEKAVKVADFSDMLDLDSLSENLEPLNELLQSLPDDKTVETLICAYADCIISSIDGVSEKSETVTVDGVSQKQTVYSVTIDEEDIVNILKSVLNKARDDSELQTIIAAVVEAVDNGSSDEVIEQMKDGIEDALGELEDEDFAGGLSDFETDIKLYVMGKEAVGFEMSADEFELSYKTADGGGKTATEFLIEVPGGEISFVGGGTKAGGRVNGEYEFAVNGISIVEFVTENLNTKKLSDGELEGTVIVSLGKGAKSAVSMTGFKDFADYNIKISAASDSAEITLNDDDKMFVGLKLTTTSDKTKKVVVPKGSDYIEVDGDIDELSSVINYEKLVDNLKEAGLPSKYAKSIDKALGR